MVENLGALGNKLITHGMLVEHDYGRLYIGELEQALDRVKNGDDESKLDVISNAISYTHLLKRHIDKEDNVIYTFANKQLSSDIINKVNIQSEEFEKKATEEGLQDKYLKLLENLELLYK